VRHEAEDKNVEREAGEKEVNGEKYIVNQESKYAVF
jgi:hypothetical protein